MEGTITRRKNMKSNKFTTSQLTILGLMAGILFLMAYTPLGYLNIGPLAVTFNVIPVAICAVVLGPTGGAVAGAVFGLTSFLQAMGIGGTSALGAALFQINPFLSAVQCFVPRILDGLLIGFIYRGMRKKCICILCSNRILFRIPEYSVLYDRTGCNVRKHRSDPESYGWKKCDHWMLYDGRC